MKGNGAVGTNSEEAASFMALAKLNNRNNGSNQDASERINNVGDSQQEVGN